MAFQILLPTAFQDLHRRCVLAWVQRGHEFRRHEWQIAIRAFDLLKEAAVMTPKGIFPFSNVYRRHIERPYADAFIQTLLEADEVEKAGINVWAKIARRIPSILRQAGLTSAHEPETRLLEAHCLYWWYSFTRGYIFEVEILQDLERSGIQFKAHSLTSRSGRLSAWDLEVLGFRGDIKRSLLFLQTRRGRHLPYAFYIVRLSQTKTSRTLVVMMRPVMWNTIDGNTVLTNLDHLPAILPYTARISLDNIDIIVADYDIWKGLVYQLQSDENKKDE